MDFTREPIIETIITPKEGHKLVVRSSTSTGQEEYVVDAVEIVAFGQAQFFRSLERPKAFLVPISDYEILEVREARMVLKNAGLDRSIKIGGGRDGTLKPPREIVKETIETDNEEEDTGREVEAPAAEAGQEVKVDKKRDRRRHYRKRRGRDEKEEGEKEEGASEPSIPALEDDKVKIESPNSDVGQEPVTILSPSVLTALLQPPPTLISETINRYRQNDQFKSAFYMTEEEQYKPHDKVHELLNEDEDEVAPPLQEPTFDPEAQISVDAADDQQPLGSEEPAAFAYISEEESILKSRIPLAPTQENDTAELPPESPYEPLEKSESDAYPTPHKET